MTLDELLVGHRGEAVVTAVRSSPQLVRMAFELGVVTPADFQRAM
jgi:hypothetical protein